MLITVLFAVLPIQQSPIAPVRATPPPVLRDTISMEESALPVPLSNLIGSPATRAQLLLPATTATTSPPTTPALPALPFSLIGSTAQAHQWQ